MEEILQQYPAPIVKNKYYFADTYSPDFVLDLHGYTRDQATKKLTWILENKDYKQWEKVRIITGKGTGILYAHVLQFCKKNNVVFSTLDNQSGYDIFLK